MKKTLIFKDEGKIENDKQTAKYLTDTFNDNWGKMKQADDCFEPQMVMAATFFDPFRHDQDRQKRFLIDTIKRAIKSKNPYTPSDMLEKFIRQDLFNKLYYNNLHDGYLINDYNPQTIREKAMNIVSINRGSNEYEDILAFIQFNPRTDKFEITNGFAKDNEERHTYLCETPKDEKRLQALKDIEAILKDNDFNAVDINNLFGGGQKLDKDIWLVNYITQIVHRI